MLWVVAHKEPTRLILQAQLLYFMGAGHLFADRPSGPIMKRKGLSLLNKCFRYGEPLWLHDVRALGVRLRVSQGHLATFQRAGVAVRLINPTAVTGLLSTEQ